MSDLIARWQADAHTQGMARTTIDSYRWSLRDFEKFCNNGGILEADKLQIRAYVEYCRHRGLTTRTIQSRLGALSGFFEWAIFEELVGMNPVREVQARYLRTYKKSNANESHTHKLINIPEAGMLVDAAVDIRDKAILTVLLKTGIRRGELVSLEVLDISWPNQSITLKPTAKRTNRTVFFDDEAAAYLRRWLAVREHRNRNQIQALWITSWGQKLSAAAVFDAVEAAGMQAGLHDPTSRRMEDHFSAHCCRHWFTTHLLRAGMRREYVQWLRGDAIKEAVDIYFHVDPEDVRRAYLAHIPQLGI